jgi:EAL domain-containing protein (putative c-di-GMP-specific phosphodiesterase class I)
MSPSTRRRGYRELYDHLAHNLRLKVIAQGVENAEQLSYLREHGCDLVQGYYFSEPLSAEEFLELLERGKPLLSVLAPHWRGLGR